MYSNEEKRIKDWDEIYKFGNVRNGLSMKEERWMECGVKLCKRYNGWKIGKIINKWNDIILKKRWKEEMKKMLKKKKLKEFNGRVWKEKCEGECVLGISEKKVKIKKIECEIIDNEFEKGWINKEKKEIRKGKKVDVVGYGKEGLEDDNKMKKDGKLVKVFERNDSVGGLMKYGIK